MKPGLSKLNLLMLAAVALMTGVGTAKDMGARQIIDHLYIARGMPVQDMTLQAEWSAAGEAQGNLQLASKEKVFFKKPNKLRVDVTHVDPNGPMDGKLEVIIRDGTSSWMFVSMGGYPVKHKEDEHSGSLLIPYFLQSYPEDANKEYVLLGKQVLSGIPTQVVRIANPAVPGDVVTAWVDTTHWVPLKLEHSVPGSKPGEAATVKRVLYSDIRQLKDGRWFPFHLELYENNVLHSVGVYKALSINTGLQDNLFEPMGKFTR